jgi:hypothetical protein
LGKQKRPKGLLKVNGNVVYAVRAFSVCYDAGIHPKVQLCKPGSGTSFLAQVGTALPEQALALVAQ